MLERRACGELAPKHHVALRDRAGTLRFEHCLTRDGFEGPYTIAYHERGPQTWTAEPTAPEDVRPRPSGRTAALRRRHWVGDRLPNDTEVAGSGAVLLHNRELEIGLVKPTRSDTRYAVNADGDALWFIHRGRGMLRSLLGDLAYAPLDYLFVPKGLLHRFQLAAGQDHVYLRLECRRGVDIPRRFRNRAGQLRMDAPYCHRDFRAPVFVGPVDEGIRHVSVKRDGMRHRFLTSHTPLDVVGWDGCVYPWTFPIRAFQPRVSSVHLPPTWHGTFAAGGALICSFVPRPLDFGPGAVPCPYPHSSVDVDEVLYYVSGDFTSRTGVGSGSLTLHPRGIPHGPQPGRYEASIGASHTEELAVMLDCQSPLHATGIADAIEDERYDASFAALQG